jgi:alcohol dehydrogenase/L-iditol 2-dehydrogenase
MTDTAVVNYAPQKHSVELRELPKATIASDQVLLEVGAVSVCGSDLHMWTGDHSWQIKYPLVLGHEFGGTIVEVGDGVEHWRVGDRVVSETAAVIDPDSPMSRRGLYNLDPNRQGFGALVDGAMRRYVPVPQRILHRVPDELPFEKAALTEPCCVAYNAVVHNSSIEPGDRVVVLGPGPIGLLCAAIAKMRGADVAVVGLEADQKRLDIAKHYGCTPIVQDADDWALARDGLGADGVIDAAGVSVTLETALRIVRPAGWITKVGWGPKPLGFSLDPLVMKNVRLQGSFSHNWPIWERIIQLLAAGTLDVAPIIGGVWPLDQWHDAFEQMHNCQIAKAVLKP